MMFRLGHHRLPGHPAGQTQTPSRVAAPARLPMFSAMAGFGLCVAAVMKGLLT